MLFTATAGDLLPINTPVDAVRVYDGGKMIGEL